MMADKLKWEKENILELIAIYRSHRLLWDQNCLEFKHRLKRNFVWESIAKKFGCPTSEIKRKIISLINYFQRERSKSKADLGTGLEEMYESSWFAYKHMLFLLYKFKPVKTVDSTIGENSQSNEVINLDEPLTETPKEPTSNQPTSNQPTPKQPTTKEPTPREPSPREPSPREPTPREPTSREPTPNSCVMSNYNGGKKRKIEDKITPEVFNIVTTIVEKKETRDQSSVFGEHVGNKLRKYNSVTRDIVEQLINNILFNADMGRYEGNTYLNIHSLLHAPTFSYNNPVAVSPYLQFNSQPNTSLFRPYQNQ